jgi:YidC/Oxa1 family membrane protein insertase
MAQQQPDQQRLFMRTLMISMVLWMVMIFMWTRFSAPQQTGKPVGDLFNEVNKLRTEKNYSEAVGRLHEIIAQSKGGEDAAKAMLLEAEIYNQDQKEPERAFQTLRQLERHYAGTETFKTQGIKYLQEVGQKVDEHNKQFISYRIIDNLVGTLGRSDVSYIIAIFLIALFVRLVQWPLANKQFASMRKMMQIAPLAKELQEKYKGEDLAKKQMELYKKYRVNPFAGCLYALIPFPFLIAVYNMFRLYEVQFQKSHFLWINPDMGAQYPGIVGTHMAQFDAPLLVLYAISMYITGRLTVTDPTQAQQQRMMSLFMTLMFVVFGWQWGFPAAFILYWLLTNVLYTVHYKIYASKPAEPLLETASGNGKSIIHMPAQDGQQESNSKVTKTAFQSSKKKKSKRK